MRQTLLRDRVREHVSAALAGRRARYSPPLRLFLIATVFFAGLTGKLVKSRISGEGR